MDRLFSTWLDRVLSKITKESIVAFCFNLYEEDDTAFSIQVVGCPSYDKQNDDWACNSAFSSKEDVFYFKSNDWNSALQEGIELVENYMRNGHYSSLLKEKEAICIGFVDGDLYQLPCVKTNY